MTWHTNLDDALAAARSEDQKVYALLTVDWCPWCRRLDDETLADPRVQEALMRTITVRLDGDQNEEIVDAYEFEVYPTALIFSPEGELVCTIEGFEEPDDYLSALQAALEDEDE